jgi:DNA repair ATPase RecN
MEQQTRHIVGLTVENVKRIKAAQINPDAAGLVQITGKNGQGKSSLIDSIEFALGGTATLPKKPIRNGADKARIVVDLGDLVVERTFKGEGSTLAVRGKDGAKYSTPQAMLDALVGKLTFDPLEFTRMKPANQRAVLMAVAGLDFTDLDTERAGAFDMRTQVNRDLKRAEFQRDAIPLVSPKPKRVEMSALTSELNTRATANKRRAELEREYDTSCRLDDDIQNEIKRVKAILKGLEEQSTQLQERCRRHQAALDAHGPTLDLEDVTEQIGRAEGTNKAADEQEARARIDEDAQSLRRKADELTARLEQIDQEKAERAQKARIPVKGLSVSDDGVLLNGVPLEQASSAEQLRVSVAMAIAMNPKLRVMLVRDGSLLDEDSLKALEAGARKHNAQVWIERVDSSGEVGIVIEDGEVAAVHAAGGVA